MSETSGIDQEREIQQIVESAKNNIAALLPLDAARDFQRVLDVVASLTTKNLRLQAQLAAQTEAIEAARSIDLDVHFGKCAIVRGRCSCGRDALSQALARLEIDA